MLDYILQKQGYVDDAQYDMHLIYDVDGRSLHFGRHEFYLITGFRFGKYVSAESYNSGDIKFKTRVFPKQQGAKITNLDLVGVLEDEELFGKLSDEDAVRVCLLLVLEVIFMGRLLTEFVDDKLLRLVEDLEAWNSFPWGEHIWRQLYNQIFNVVERHRFQHLKGLQASSKFVPTYTLSGFVWAFKIWILESFERSNCWWNKQPDVIPRGIAWSKKQVFKKSDYGSLFGKELKINFDLKATLGEQQSEFYIQSREYIMEYIPRTIKRKAPHDYDVYLQKLDALRKRGMTEKKYLPLLPRIDASSLITEIGVKDSVIQKLNNRVFKLESIIQVLACERTCGFREKLDFTRSFSHLSTQFQEQLSRAFGELVDSLISNRHSLEVHVYSDDDILQEYLLDEELMLRKQEEEKWKIEDQKAKEMVFLEALREEVDRRVEREKLLKESRERKKARLAYFKSEHWQIARADNRSLKDGSESSYYWSSKFVEAEKIRIPPKGYRDRDMTEFLKDVKPWVENLNRVHKSISHVHVTDDYNEFLLQPGPLRCTFPWSKEPVRVDRRFWESLICLDPPKKGWLMDEHIELWVEYMLHFRPVDADWCMVTAYFVQLLLQDSIPIWYANGEKYKISWGDVDHVFMPINEKDKHWFLARFEISTGIVTFYDSASQEQHEGRPWYLYMRSCLQVKRNI